MIPVTEPIQGHGRRFGKSVWKVLTMRDGVHNARLIDMLPVLAIGALLVLVWPKNGWTILLWFVCAFVSVYFTKGHIPEHAEPIVEPTNTTCPLPQPRATDKPGHFIVHEPNGHIYSIPFGTLGQDEYLKAWRLTPTGEWEPWD